MVYENGDQNDSHSLIRPFFWRLVPTKLRKNRHVFGASPGSPSAGLGEIPTIRFCSQEQIRTLRTRFENREVLEVSHPKNQLPLVGMSQTWWSQKWMVDTQKLTKIYINMCGLRPNFDPYLLWRLNPFFVAESSFSPNHPQFLVGLMPWKNCTFWSTPLHLAVLPNFEPYYPK